MKKIASILLLSFFGLTAFAQKKSKTDETAAPKPNTQKLEAAYARALTYGDFEAAKNTVYLILSEAPGNLAWQDTLVQLYYSIGAYAQCVLSGNDYLSKNDSNYNIREFVAASQFALKRHKEALSEYEKLFSHSKSAFHAYQLAINQYLLQRYGECEQSIQFILADFESDKQKVMIGMNNGGSQEVPMKAAAWNLRGVVLKDLNKAAEGKICFEQSLKLYPDFILAQTNLESVKPQAAPVAPAAAPSAPVKAPSAPKK